MDQFIHGLIGFLVLLIAVALVVRNGKDEMTGRVARPKSYITGLTVFGFAVVGISLAFRPSDAVIMTALAVAVVVFNLATGGWRSLWMSAIALVVLAVISLLGLSELFGEILGRIGAFFFDTLTWTNESTIERVREASN